jgi:hypothetical protein
MAPRRPLTDAEKEEKNRKKWERYAQQDPQLKPRKLNEENGARAQSIRDQKKSPLNKEDANREEAERKKRQRQN